MCEGGHFGYRIYYPPMRVGKYEVFWHFPLVSYLDRESCKPKVLDKAPLGYLTAYDARKPDLSKPVELWPELRERNLLVMIPGKDRSRAIVMADHYDTAYMEDLYYRERGGKLARVAAAGADDNHSTTAALMLAVPVFLSLSRAGKLDRDVWLVHLTGEEFPSDCMGARHLAQSIIEGTLNLHQPGQSPLDLPGVKVEGVCVLDMIAHNRERDRDVFQISPGYSKQSVWLAYQAHLANMIWNAHTVKWNRKPPRRRRKAGRRSKDGVTVPDIARHPRLRGEIRLPRDMRSSLFNTDGQIFSDMGMPVVLFMENYDINRVGYHDSYDDMTNIDLDYGAAVAAIAIESVARAATVPIPSTAARDPLTRKADLESGDTEDLG